MIHCDLIINALGQVGALAILTRQTNIVWVAFIMAVSLIRRLKEVDIVELDEDEDPTGQRAWILFDPLAADARFPCMLPLPNWDIRTTLTLGCR